jgi:hypothetical protein
MPKQTIKKIDFQKLRRLQETSLKNFGGYLWDLPRELMDSLSTGLGAGQTALTLVGAGVATALTTTGALTVLGSMVMGIAGGVTGVIAITLGVLGMVRQFKKNQKEVRDTLRESIDLKKKLAVLAYHCEHLNDADLENIVLGLDGIVGDSLIEKLCNLYEATPATEEELQKKMRENLEENSAFEKNVEDINVSLTLSAGITRLNTVHKNNIETTQSEVQALMGDLKLNPNKYTDIYARHSADSAINGDPQARDRLTNLLEKIATQPGLNFKQKIASLFRIEHESNLQTATEEDRFNSLGLLEEAIYKEIECQYFELLTSHSINETADAFHNRFKLTFESKLAFIEGDNYNSKIDKLFNRKTFQSTATLFKARAEKFPRTDKTVTNLIAAKKIIDDRESTTMEKFINNAQSVFAGFLGGMTGFGIVVGIAAVVGVSIGTAGIGLAVLAAAAAATVIGVALTLWARKKSREKTDSFSKNIQDTESLIKQSLMEAKSLTSQANTNKLAAQTHAELAARDQVISANADRLRALEEENRSLKWKAASNERAFQEAKAKLTAIILAPAQPAPFEAHAQPAPSEAHAQPTTSQAQTTPTLSVPQTGSKADEPSTEPEANRHLSPPDSPQPLNSGNESHHHDHDHRLSQFVSKDGGLLGRPASRSITKMVITDEDSFESADDDDDGDTESAHEKLLKEI